MSLLNQDFKSLEILVVDDGSSAAICENLKIIDLRKTHKGVGAARNLRACNVKGNILVMVDADMIFDSNYITTLVAPTIRGEAITTYHCNEMVSKWDNPCTGCQMWFNGLPDRRQHPFAVAEYSGQYRAVRKNFLVDNGEFGEGQMYKTDISILQAHGCFCETTPWRGLFPSKYSNHHVKRCNGDRLTELS